MATSYKNKIKLIVLAVILLFTLGACAPAGNVDTAAATERALVASLTALAENSRTEVSVVGTPESRDGSGGSADVGIDIISMEVENNFPDSITFEIVATSEVPLRRVAFFYWLQGQDSRNLETVEFSTGDEINASPTWDTARCSSREECKQEFQKLTRTMEG